MTHPKEQRWQDMYAQATSWRDKLDKGIDPGILDTVIVFNLLGMSTVMSCEGHLQGASGAPWIDIEDKEATEEEPRITRMFKEAREAHVQGAISEHLFHQAHQARISAMRKQLALRRILMDYLVAFYSHRQVPYEVQLVIQSRAGGKSRLESQGAAFQEVLEEQERSDNLRRYQEEMQAFTGFLRQCYFLEG